MGYISHLVSRHMVQFLDPGPMYGGPGGHAMRRYLSAVCDVKVDDDDVTVDDDDVTVDDDDVTVDDGDVTVDDDDVTVDVGDVI